APVAPVVAARIASNSTAEGGAHRARTGSGHENRSEPSDDEVAAATARAITPSPFSSRAKRSRAASREAVARSPSRFGSHRAAAAWSGPYGRGFGTASNRSSPYGPGTRLASSRRGSQSR